MRDFTRIEDAAIDELKRLNPEANELELAETCVAVHAVGMDRTVDDVVARIRRIYGTQVHAAPPSKNTEQLNHIIRLLKQILEAINNETTH